MSKVRAPTPDHSPGGPAPLVAPSLGLKAGTAPSELRRFIAGLRIITMMLCALALLADRPVWAWTGLLLLLYGGWCAWLVWREGNARPTGSLLVHGWIDVACINLLLAGLSPGGDLLALAFVQPVVIVSISHGVRQGVVLSLFAAAGLLLDVAGQAQPLPAPIALGAVPTGTRLLLALGVLGLAPAAALLSRPLTALRQRLALADRLEAEIDPRRGLEAVSLALVDRLRRETHASVAALVQPARDQAPAVLSTPDDGSFRAPPAVHQQLENLLQLLPDGPISFHARHRLADRIVLHQVGERPDVQAGASLSQMAELLEVERFVILPLARFGRRHGYLMIGHRGLGLRDWSVASLSQLAPDLARLIEQAALVDELHGEIASHERARIGRDLHDSAIQPYLGIKYAIESVAVRTRPDHPLASEIGDLVQLVNHEITELRDTISALRSGETRGDNALIPAVRRQIRRFQRLFGIEVQLDCPPTLPTSRALAGALFHMINEALNNVRKHTTARSVWITLASTPQEILLTIRDDAGTQQGRPQDDFLPRSLDERVRELRGTLRLLRSNGLDTELHITIPV